VAEDPSTPPACPADGVTMFPTTRTMRSHGLEAGKTVPYERTVTVWRCPKCGKELPRQ
jgi:hypothetical protein